ncbi:hypothetical protein [Clostridioides difficile]|uniref:Cystatin domain-containing protein n=3 Tax=Clostridioides difficile TaxID=1496 RepID=A0AAX3H177_CLODI|nr:hypothetical protein [Clostridioides difficile]AVD36127.1 hypothetical protein C4E42_09930 [Clostridioides difficile]AVD40422.1 hypothetical protein C4E26_14675 [Clostridioides difficile]AVD43935.1 hypothetical protein C4E25_14685 [Clostridioides difficile]AXU67013.1 hypothetical protein CDIF29020_00679 [Clostridioides difficile]AXU89186.1 hypothetical protein CDIF29747_00639 [Clostridioides difficile]
MSLIVGGWSKFRAVEEEDLKVFNEAVGMLKGVDYEPLIVATQIVAGTNFKFICNATSVTNPPHDYLAEIIIFNPLPCDKQKATITSINIVK